MQILQQNLFFFCRRILCKTKVIRHNTMIFLVFVYYSQINNQVILSSFHFQFSNIIHIIYMKEIGKFFQYYVFHNVRYLVAVALREILPCFNLFIIFNLTFSFSLLHKPEDKKTRNREKKALMSKLIQKYCQKFWFGRRPIYLVSKIFSIRSF